jgi:ElaB/YqjD/DUF883 family membrane-anchored ribosome-binding protein
MAVAVDELRKLHEEMTNVVSIFQKKNDEALEEVRKYGEANALLKSEVEKANQAITDLRSQQEDLLKRAQRPAVATAGDADKGSEELRSAFVSYLRSAGQNGPDSGKLAEYRSALAKMPENVRALAEKT